MTSFLWKIRTHKHRRASSALFPDSSPRAPDVGRKPCRPCKSFFVDLVCNLNSNRTVEGCLPSVDSMILWRLEVTFVSSRVLSRESPSQAHCPPHRSEHCLRARLLCALHLVGVARACLRADRVSSDLKKLRQREVEEAEEELLLSQVLILLLSLPRLTLRQYYNQEESFHQY
eukprot:768283-Hanusia_phi.AAC.5